MMECVLMLIIQTNIILKTLNKKKCIMIWINV